MLQEASPSRCLDSEASTYSLRKSAWNDCTRFYRIPGSS